MKTNIKKIVGNILAIICMIGALLALIQLIII